MIEPSQITDGIGTIGIIKIVVVSIIFFLTYLSIISEKLPHAFASLLGGILMIKFNIIDQHTAFHAIELDIILLLVGMMIIVRILSETGFFQWTAIKLAKFVKGEPLSLLLMLIVITALSSALLDSAITILLIAPISILLAEQLEIDPIPFLICETMAANIGGTATLIGNPPNMLIGNASNLSFNDFLLNLGPVVAINIIVFIFTIWLVFRKKLNVSRELKARIMSLEADRALKDKKLLIKALVVIFFVTLGFMTHAMTHLEPSTIALGGAIILCILAKKKPEKVFEKVEWETLFFFIGLFIMVETLVKIGVVKFLADKALMLTHGDFTKTSMLILWISAIFSSVIENVPHTATLIPLIKEGILPSIVTETPEVLWWSLSLGACLGGNATLFGASSNHVVAGIASQSGRHLSFFRFMKYGTFIAIQSLIISSIYLYFVYLK